MNIFFRFFLSLCFSLCFFLVVLTSLPAGAEHKTFSRKEGILSVSDRINAFFFNSKTHRLVVLDEGSLEKPKYGSLDAAMRRSPCIAGVNGGFFGADPAGTPLGAVIHEGKKVSPLSSGSFTVSGLLRDSGKDITLQRTKSYLTGKNKSILQEALQGGPFLVENGKSVTGLNNTKSTYRTFIATDRKGNWCIAMTSPMTLAELAAWLATPGCLGSFSVKDALNLDGGSSSSFWCRSTGTYFPAMKNVRNYLGIAIR